MQDEITQDDIEEWAKTAALVELGLVDYYTGKVRLARAFEVIDSKLDMHPPDWCPLIGGYEFDWDDYFEQDCRCTEKEYLNKVGEAWKERIRAEIDCDRRLHPRRPK